MYARLALALLLTTSGLAAAGPRRTLDLNGTWDFDQTTTAFPPQRFTRRIPVPGLIHLARPPIEQADRLFVIDTNNVTGVSGNPYTAPYRPRYNWYRRRVPVDAALRGRRAVLTIGKSMFGTTVYVNGREVGHTMACYTPVDCDVTRALRYGAGNEILIRVGDRAWLPSAAAGSTDKEKVNYLPGIWDAVSLSFTGPLRIHRALCLPSLRAQALTVKLLVHDFRLAQIDYGDPKTDTARVTVQLHEHRSGRAVGAPVTTTATVTRDRRTALSLRVPVPEPHPWSPDDPFLYEARIRLDDGQVPSDSLTQRFGMRDFGRRGRHFTLNGHRLLLRGSNITLHRFFEDPHVGALPWDRTWVRRLLDTIPKQIHWNAMRICVGIAPSLWYDIADEAGLILQNEWMYWQTHGWDEQVRREYTDWVWTDGSHPSICLWDAINENWDPFIGNVLIPELRELDPTRIWDAGYMGADDMAGDEMDEPHPYRAAGRGADFAARQERAPYALGDLDNWVPGQWQTNETFDRIRYSSAAQLVNEYGWVWLWRDGRPAKLTHAQYDYFVGPGAPVAANRAFQAYWLQCETEWLRAERSLAGVLAFCYLTNDFGHTGDWFVGDIADLQPGPTLAWFRDAFAPAAVFIDRTDERYTKHLPPHPPGTPLRFNLVGVNDGSRPVTGSVRLRLRDADGRVVHDAALPEVTIPAYDRCTLPQSLDLPRPPGGYLLTATFTGAGDAAPVTSRRYLKVGSATTRWRFYDLPENRP